MNYTAYKDSYSEVLYLINNMTLENRNKIPKKFISFLQKNKNKNYKVKDISLNNIDSLKRETKIILSIMYRNYFKSENGNKDIALK